jgi:ribosomal protein L29
MAYTPGPKELAQKALREDNQRKNRKPSVADVRKNIAKIKPVTRHGGKRGR